MPEWRDAVNREGGELNSMLEEEQHPHYQYPPLLHAPAKGFGALSRTDNPWRERFLVPLYACNEQETGSQMHVRQLLHLAKATNRTLVLPNWGFGVSWYCLRSFCSLRRANAEHAPTRSPPFPTAVPTPSTPSTRPNRPTQSVCGPCHIGHGLLGCRGSSSAPRSMPGELRWRLSVLEVLVLTLLTCRISVIFFRDTHKVLSDSIATSDEGILKEGCVPTEPFKIDEPPLYIATNGETYLSSVVNKLRETDHLQTLFVIFNHYSDFKIKGGELFPDPLMQVRPKEWGLWVGAPWPQWNYSAQVNTMFTIAQSKLPERYAAMQWRMELMPPKVLQKCSDMFAEAIISGMRAKGLTTIYVASDMPLGKDRSRSKSASFNAPEVAQARESIDHLVYRLNEASFQVRTWNDLKPEDGDEVSLRRLIFKQRRASAFPALGQLQLQVRAFGANFKPS